MNKKEQKMEGKWSNRVSIFYMVRISIKNIEVRKRKLLVCPKIATIFRIQLTRKRSARRELNFF